MAAILPPGLIKPRRKGSCALNLKKIWSIELHDFSHKYSDQTDFNSFSILSLSLRLQKKLNASDLFALADLYLNFFEKLH
jgi:hypothetical protein